MSEYRVTEDVHGEIRVDDRVISLDYPAGVHRDDSDDDKIALAHLEALGLAEPAKRKSATVKE